MCVMGLPPNAECHQHANRKQEHNDDEGESTDTRTDALRDMFRGSTHRIMEKGKL